MGDWSGPHGITLHRPPEPAKVQAVLDAGAELATSASMLLSFAHDPPEVVRGALHEDVCMAHGEALVCRHGCEQAAAHQCGDRALVADLCGALEAPKATP